VSYNPAYNPFETNREERGKWKEEGEYSAILNSKDKNLNGFYEDNPQDNLQRTSQGDEHISFLFPLSSFHSDSSLLEASPSHYQYKARYIMTAVKSGLMVIDQHRASVRILFDRYATSAASSASAEGGTPSAVAFSSQRLLFPETLQLAPSDAVLMDQILPELATLGFDFSPLGGSTFAINGIPAGLEGLNPLALLQQIIADVADHDAQSGAASQSLGLSVTQSLHLSLARAAAIPYGQVLSNDEMESLVNTLFTSSNVNYTPDGKPILVILPQSDIDGLFTAKR
jgi:DNA mismatch repair protein MutL